MGCGRFDGASGLVILVFLVPFGLCHLGESLAEVVAKRGEFGCGFDLLGVARSGCAIVPLRARSPLSCCYRASDEVGLCLRC
jgi:hypothetical protein